MSRWCERDDRNDESASLPDALSRGGGDAPPRLVPETSRREDFGANRREHVLGRSRVYSVRPSERAVLDALGRFRVIDAKHLVRELYGGNSVSARADIDSLRRQRLIGSAALRSGTGPEKQVLTLTREGHAVAQSQARPGQQLYWGYARPAECAHDANLYRAYRHEERRLASHGHHAKRVVLDYELKREYFSRLNAPDGSRTYRERQHQSAREVHLPIVDGHVVFPDFRIEYEDERGERGRVDVEVATGNYRGQHIATKGAAGFRVYGDAGAARRMGVSEGRLGAGCFVPEERSGLLLL